MKDNTTVSVRLTIQRYKFIRGFLEKNNMSMAKLLNDALDVYFKTIKPLACKAKTEKE